MLRLNRGEVFGLCSRLSNMGYDVVAPMNANGSLRLANWEPGSEPVLDYIRINNSPKDFLLPVREPLYKYKSTTTITSYGMKMRFPTSEGPCPIAITPEYSLPKSKLAFFGIHPCMLNSVAYLDEIMLSDPYLSCAVTLDAFV